MITTRRKKFTQSEPLPPTTSCISKNLVGQLIQVREASGDTFSGTIVDVTDTHISIQHRIKGFRMCACAEVNIVSIQKKKKGCGCGKRN